MSDKKMNDIMWYLSLEHRLGYTFKNTDILRQALTHCSYSSIHNERLEFLGDSILNCVIASLLFEHYNSINEGDLSRFRSNLVKQQTLYEIAKKLELSKFLLLGDGEIKSGGCNRPSILADTLEAIFGAIFLDSHFGNVQKVIYSLYKTVLNSINSIITGKDSKTLLQEYLQKRKIPLPEYKILATYGAAHNQKFEIICIIPKLKIKTCGIGPSRRSGEQMAANLALNLVRSSIIKISFSSEKLFLTDNNLNKTNTSNLIILPKDLKKNLMK
ncbi:ribonuclease III [Candidatus Profftella armatura]|uniref:Ribonuclease 3 n=1 Tax=Candidatus Profftella armatura TaxID=669502 RepID=S5RLX3_9PROT|nr:ribonuclease III [Candidatus Profftella armatura]AGS06936.1 ribonuclease III [Candidatus Profftella armatura]